MKQMLAVVFSFSTAAQAHESLAPHAHPHGISMLPGTDTAIACALLALAAALIAYWKFGRTP